MMETGLTLSLWMIQQVGNLRESKSVLGDSHTKSCWTHMQKQSNSFYLFIGQTQENELHG